MKLVSVLVGSMTFVREKRGRIEETISLIFSRSYMKKESYEKYGALWSR